MKKLWFEEMLSKLGLTQKEPETPKELEVQKGLGIKKWSGMQTASNADRF
jgi:hypothetical protein